MSRTRPSSLIRAFVVAVAIVVAAAGCNTAPTPNAGSVKILAGWFGQDQATFLDVLKPFESSTGIRVDYEATRDLDQSLTARAASGDLPDVSSAPGPTTVSALIKQSKLLPLDDKIDVNALRQNYPQTWIDLGTIQGKTYQLFAWVDLKGLVWYSPKSFQANGYNVPRSWDDLLALQDTIKTGGAAPWCIALDTGSASGWPGTDWLKEIVLAQAGPAVYDGWVAGKQKWTSPEIKASFQTWGTILGPKDGNVYGGAQLMKATSVVDGGTHMFDSPPKCYMHNQASFITSLFTSSNPNLQPITDFNFFPLPDINSQFTGTHVVEGDSFVMTRDTPQARKLLTYLSTGPAQAIWVAHGGKISPSLNVRFDLYKDPLARQLAQIVGETKIARFDATDQMPASMRAAAYKAVLDFVVDQSKLDTILKTLDQVQTAAYK